MIKVKIIAQGAEATLYEDEYLGKRALVKERKVKKYRNGFIDEKLRKERTKGECMLIHKAKEAGVESPVIYKVEKANARIVMEFVEGKRLKEVLNEKNLELCKELGKEIAKLHLTDIVHGDLTTSNVIWSRGKLVFVDFGLGYQSGKIEDKAVDLLVFKKTFLATHSNLVKGWGLIVKGYLAENKEEGKQIVKQIEKIEKRVRYS